MSEHGFVIKKIWNVTHKEVLYTSILYKKSLHTKQYYRSKEDLHLTCRKSRYIWDLGFGHIYRCIFIYIFYNKFCSVVFIKNGPMLTYELPRTLLRHQHLFLSQFITEKCLPNDCDWMILVYNCPPADAGRTQFEMWKILNHRALLHVSRLNRHIWFLSKN